MKRATPYVRLAAGVYLARRGQGIHIVTTADDAPPDQTSIDQRTDDFGGTSTVLAKENWLADGEITPQQLATAVGSVFPDWRGELVNVGTEEEPFLLTQQQAELYQRHVAAAVEAAQPA